MDTLTESVSVVISLIALFSIVLFAVLNIYLIRRNGFYINVNCWFCNQWNKVLYGCRNSFVCPFCLQYNGFNKDGGYNKIIEEQHDTSAVLNKTLDKTERFSNGLCSYCNNNQRLKVKLLANFTPLNEKKFDIEIEHFQKQLEKSYKLCRKCDQVLKATLNNQQSWIFGSNLKNLLHKGQSKLKNSTRLGRTKYLKFLRHILSILSIVVFCQILKIRLDYPITENLQKFIPKHFNLRNFWFNDIFVNVMNRTLENDWSIIMNFNIAKIVKLEDDFLFITTSLGLFFHMILFVSESSMNWWKLNETLGWITIFMTSLIPFTKDLNFYIKILQVFTSSALFYSYIVNKSTSNNNVKTIYKFKKFKTSQESQDLKYTNNYKTVHSDIHCHNSYNNSSLPFNNLSFPNNLHSPINLNNSLNSARSTSFLNRSSNSSTNSLHKDLNISLDNLHLTNSDNRSQSCTSPVFSISSQKRPVLSPSKLKNITQNSWTAGGFWKNDLNNTFPISSETFQPSRSSSQTSGFISNHAFQSLPPSREESICGDIEHNSVLSEPTYHHQNLFPSTFTNKTGQHLYYRADNNTFYPVLTSNNMLFLHSTLPEFGFGNFSVNSFQTKTNMNSPVYVLDKRCSNLFKNVQFENNFQKPRI